MTDNTTALATVPLDETYSRVLATLEAHPLTERVRFTRQGLELAPDLTLDECQSATMFIAERLKFDAVEANLMHFCLGQMINYAETRWGDKYVQWLDATGLEYSTLANTAYVARQVDSSFWKENLGWTHHVAVAPLPPEDQQRWLSLAEKEEIGANELRRRIQAEKDVAAGRDPDQAAIGRELQRIARKMGERLPDYSWPATILHGLLIPLTRAANKERQAIDFLNDLNDATSRLRCHIRTETYDTT